MNVFIVHAHHEPRSFNAAMTAQAVETLAGAGHRVVVSDLYGMAFDPISDRRNFTTVKDPAYLRQQDEEAHASERDGFAPDVQAEMDKLLACDLLIFQFPLWWFGLPAILKGWVDRVFAQGRVFGGGRMYERGVFAGKRALCAVTTGGREALYHSDGLHGSVEQNLYPVHHGILAFTGFSVLRPFAAHAPHRMLDAERAARLAAYDAYLRDLDAQPLVGFATKEVSRPAVPA